MSRLLIESIKDRVEHLGKRKVRPSGRMTLVTGRLGSRLMNRHLLPIVSKALPDLSIEVITVTNSTFGRSVTVSGLLSGADIASAVKHRGIHDGILVLPPNTVNHRGRMIDDIRPADLGKTLGMKVLVPEEDFLESKVLRALRKAAG